MLYTVLKSSIYMYLSKLKTVIIILSMHSMQTFAKAF